MNDDLEDMNYIIDSFIFLPSLFTSRLFPLKRSVLVRRS